MMSTRQFAFGENWKSFAAIVTDENVSAAVQNLEQLVTPEQIAGARFLDIGCGSGLAMLAALRLGASEVVGIDLDPDSVAAARGLLQQHAPQQNWRVERGSVFDLCNIIKERFPIVHSWGVLHHTGDMRRAIKSAAEMVEPNGTLAISIYLRTFFCQAWAIEKRIYSKAPGFLQLPIRIAYGAARSLRTIAAGENPISFARKVHSHGMSWKHDLHDWLGGYPYESASPDEVLAMLADCGISARRIDHGKTPIGVLGSTCAEYVGRRAGGSSPPQQQIDLPRRPSV